ncbi:MAG TPA: phosphopantetheine-binding protein [Myxococcota bacterium]|nr:phosphopantetheine-binding protein [Myxococcota bacterium]
MSLGIPTSREDIQARVLAILSREFDVDAAEISPETDLQNDLDFDSLDGVALAGWIEEETGLALSDEDIEQMRTIGEIVELVHERVRATVARTG